MVAAISSFILWARKLWSRMTKQLAEGHTDAGTLVHALVLILMAGTL